MQAPADLAVSDAAKRISDAMTLHTLAGSAGLWASFRMDDGREVSPATAYETRVAAVRAARWNRDTVIYLEITPDGVPPHEAQGALDYARGVHDLGFRIPMPEFNYDPTMPLLPSDRVKSARHLASGGKR